MTRLNTRKNQRGVLSIVFAVTIIGLLGFAGLAIDVGYMQWERRRIQAAADAAAMGGLRELEIGNSGNIISSGKNDASLNGFTDGSNSTTVTINTPPTSGSYSGDTLAVESIVSRAVPTFFMRIFGQNGITVSARAVAKTSGTTSNGAIGSCIYALNTSAKSSFKINGSQNNMYVYTACSITDESSSNQAYTQGSNAVLYIGNAQVGVVGGWTFNGGSQIYSGTSGTAAYKGPVHVTSPGDPFDHCPEPSYSGVTIQKSALFTNTNGMTTTLDPGVYCGGIQMTGGSLTFNPGFYVVNGVGLNINGGTVSGTGVSFYITPDNWTGCTASGKAGVTINGATVNLSAPTSGGHEGFLFYQAKSCTNGTCQDANIAGNGNSTLDGALYFKNESLSFAGSNSSGNCGYMVLVADQISLNGASKFNNGYSCLSPGTNFPFAPLATGGGLVQ